VVVNDIEVNPSAHLTCCFDVSKRSLSLYAEYRSVAPSGASSCRVEDEIPNRTGAIEPLLDRLAGLAREAGLDGLTVCAEATGGYERKLLHTARRLGHQTALISPEHVAKLKAVESNDAGKTDHKDPRVMHLVARLGKTQAHRHLPAIYRRLRRLTTYYDEDEQVLAATRQRIQAVTEDLFPDYDKPATFTFGSTGEALMEAYAFNPYAICRAGYTRFKKTMKRRVNARFQTLEHLFACAEQAVRIPLLLHLAQLLAQTAKLIALVGGKPVGAFAVVSVGLLQPVADGLLGRFELLGQFRGLPPVSSTFGDPISEFLGIWWTCSWHGRSRSVIKVKKRPPNRVSSTVRRCPPLARRRAQANPDRSQANPAGCPILHARRTSSERGVSLFSYYVNTRKIA
jgi:hypothetical protein